MRWLVIFVLVMMITGCAGLSCSDRERDGGIGGTGTCDREEPRTVLAFLEDTPNALVQFP